MKFLLPFFLLLLSLGVMGQADDLSSLDIQHHEGAGQHAPPPHRPAPVHPGPGPAHHGPANRPGPHGEWHPHPGWHAGWTWNRAYHPAWWHVGFAFPAFVFVANVPTGYWQCTAFNQGTQSFSEIGPDQNQAAYGALYACGGAGYEAAGCYIPDGYCQPH